MKKIIFFLLVILGYKTTSAQCAFSATVTTTTASCHLSCTGTVTFNVTGGTPPYIIYGEFGYDTLVSGIPVTGFCAGYHLYDIYDDAGCYVSGTVNIPSLNTLTGATVNFTNTPESCVGFEDGISSVNVIGAGAPYQVYFCDRDYLTDYAVGLPPGTHQVEIIDNAGQCATYTTTIDPAQPLTDVTITPSITPSTCDIVSPNGTIALSASGIGAPCTYYWYHDLGTSATATGLESGTYYVKISSSTGGCESRSYTVNIIPSGSCPGFGGRVYHDINNNCVFDAGDVPADYYQMRLDSTFDLFPDLNVVTDSLGYYRFYVPYGDYRVSAYYQGAVLPYYFNLDTTCVGHYDVTNSAGSPVITNLDFPLDDNDYCGTGVTYTMSANCTSNDYTVTITSDSSVIVYPLGEDIGPASAYGWVGGAHVPPDTTMTVLVRQYPGNCVEYLQLTSGPPVIEIDSLIDFNIIHESCAFGYDGAIEVINHTGIALNYVWSTGETMPGIDGLAMGSYQFHADSANVCCDTTLSVFRVDTLCPKIVGRVFYDVNGNCTYDAGIDSTSFYSCDNSIRINSESWFIPFDTTGYFEYACAPGTYDVSIGAVSCYVPALSANIFTDPCWNNVIVTLDSTTIISDTVYFPLNETASPDVTVYCEGWGAVPGFNMNYSINYYNYSTLTSGQLYCVLDDSVTFISATTPVDYISGDTLFWNIASVGSTHSHIVIVAEVMPDVDLLGSYLENSCGFISDLPETNIANNFCSHSTLVVGSYDPNEKLVSPSGIGPHGYIHEDNNQMTYRINFQNTGTAPAHQVVVVDTLSEQLDLSTLHILESSHPYTFSLAGRVCTFTFHEIMLPDSTTDEPGSHGHITYRIMHNDGLTEFTTIENTAYIYFDFNPAIVTNTTLNTINNSLGVQETAETVENPFRVFPNPFSGLLQVVSPDGQCTYEITLTDIAGKTVWQQGNLAGRTVVETGQINKGVYILRIMSGTNAYAFRVIRQ